MSMHPTMEKVNPGKVMPSGGSLPLRKWIQSFLPYWHFFLLLLFLSAALSAWYLTTAIPIYESYASILIKDEKRGQDDSKMEEAMNLFGQKNIVENEIEILKSNLLLEEVVKHLRLYAPVSEEYGWKKKLHRSAYHSSPVLVEVRDSVVYRNTGKIYFSMVGSDSIAFMNQIVPLGQWVTLPGAEIRFVKNPQWWKGFMEEDGHFYFNLLTNGKAAREMSGRLAVTSTSKQASVVMLKFRDEVPERGEEVLSTIIHIYGISILRRKNQTAWSTLQFIDKRLARVEAELDSVEKGIQQYRNSSGVVNISEQSTQYLRNMEQTDMEMNRIRMQMAVIDQVDQYIKGQSDKLIAPSVSQISDQSLSQMLDRLYTKELELEKIKKTTAENNPIITALESEIARVKASITENLQNQQKNLQAGSLYLNKISRNYASLLNSIPQKEKQLVEVSRQRNIKSDIYSYLLQRREEAMYSLSSSLADSHVVEAPATLGNPVSPKISFIVVLTLIFPIFMGIFFLSARDYLQGKIMYRDDIRSLTQVPIIGELGYDKKEIELIQDGQPRSMVKEQIRLLQASYRSLAMQRGPLRKILVTSMISGEGKSFIVSHLAVGFAKSGLKVVLLEMDLYRPRLRALFHQEDGPGVAEYLGGGYHACEILRATTIPGLSIITSGNRVESPHDLIMKGNISAFFKQLEDRFDVILIDAPPTSPVSDAFEIARHCDAVIYVVRHGVTPKSGLELLDEEIEMHKVKNPFIVFNGVKKRGVGKYSYGYGHGYGYDDRNRYAAYTK